MKVCQGWTRRVFEVKSTSAIVTKVIMIIIIINISLASCFLCYGLNFLVWTRNLNISLELKSGSWSQSTVVITTLLAVIITSLLVKREKAVIVAAAVSRPGCEKLLRGIVHCWIYYLDLSFSVCVWVCVQSAAGRLSSCATPSSDTPVRLCSASGIQLFHYIQLLHNLDSSWYVWN